MTADANSEGLRILRSEPTLFSMELLWRWSFGLGMLALAFYAYARVRPAVFITDADVLTLQGHDPVAAAATASGILGDAMPMLLRTLAEICAPLAVLWIVAATLGRGIISRIVVRRFAADYNVAIAADAPRWFAFGVLHLARVLMLLILVIGYLGGIFLAAFVSGTEVNLLLSTVVIFCAFALSAVLWSYVNWVLSVAPIFVARDALSPLDAIVESIAFIRRNYPRLASIASWNGLMRGIAATIISVAGILTVVANTVLPPWAVAVLLGVETLVYFFVSDLFLLARLGAYASVALRELTLAQAQSPDHSGTTAR
jgi:hypothetical protein